MPRQTGTVQLLSESVSTRRTRHERAGARSPAKSVVRTRGLDDTEGMREQKHKPKLVILGTGWGSVALLKQLVPGEYHVTVVSPSNHFLFTPMLPSATVGTLEFRSLVEPDITVRHISHEVAARTSS